MALSREMELILCCLRSFAGAEHLKAPQPSAQPLDQKRLCNLALSEGVAGIVADRLNRDCPQRGLGCPDQLREEAQHAFARGGAFWAEALRLRAGLESAGIAALLLKGAALLATVYRGRLSLRPLSDIDLLVRPQDLPVVDRLLRRHGLAPHSEGSLFYLNRKLAVDLHLDLIGAERIRNRACACRMDLAAVWSASRPWPEGGSPSAGGFRLLSPVHQFLHLSVHALKHSFSRLIWFADLALTWQQANPRRVLEQAAEFRMERPLLYALRGLRDLLGLNSVEPCLARLPRPNSLEEFFLGRMVRRRNCSLGGVVQACSVPDWKGRFSYLAESAFPRRQIMSEMFPRTSPWLAYPWRAARLMRAGMREVVKTERL